MTCDSEVLSENLSNGTTIWPVFASTCAVRFGPAGAGPVAAVLTGG